MPNCFHFFDEIDAIAPIRGQGESGSQINERMVGQLLLEMDNMASQEGVVILAATNRPELIDKALLRPGRFDFVVDLPMPDLVARLAILQSHCRHRPVDPNVDIGGLAARTANMTGADLQSLCQRAALLAIRQSVSTCPGPDFLPFTIDNDHFELALLEMTQDNPG
ncbi:AAA family ATPase [Sodalis sp. dw_96]|uniref:AAA family ATPase n=1 Tax=Sodalis sp. dw_96 TaxID=2719794 RepID=UPI001BD4B691|nr:AAA family ATPase [Sodalis sp. dw_96]